MTNAPASAVIVRTRLPDGLERRRRRFATDADRGVPAHLTLLYPFVEPAMLDTPVRRRIAAVAAHHDPFDYRLLCPARWPDVLYVAVEPVERFVALQADLASAFPDHPVYGEPAGFVYIPHVTVAEGPPIEDPTIAAGAAWSALPRPARATAIEIIATDGGRWRLVWRVRLGGSGRR